MEIKIKEYEGQIWFSEGNSVLLCFLTPTNYFYRYFNSQSYDTYGLNSEQRRTPIYEIAEQPKR